MKKAIIGLAFAVCAGLFQACSEEKLDPNSIFGNESPERNAFDLWLLENYVYEYNLDFKYRLDDNETDMKYNLIPADIEKSRQLARIILHLWFESYNELFDETGVDKTFMREYGPKVIQLVGSSAINAASSTEVLGTAEGGIKIVLYKVNAIDPTDIDMLNDYYFGTMHHEFAHILHQTEEIPTEFNKITAADYSSTGWQNRSDLEAWKLGFVTPYASREPQEDFVEIIANYLIKPDGYWEYMLRQAGESGASKIQEKFGMVEEWLFLTWDIDIHKLREIIKRRSQDIKTIVNS